LDHEVMYLANLASCRPSWKPISNRAIMVYSA